MSKSTFQNYVKLHNLYNQLTVNIVQKLNKYYVNSFIRFKEWDFDDVSMILVVTEYQNYYESVPIERQVTIRLTVEEFSDFPDATGYSEFTFSRDVINERWVHTIGYIE